MAILSKQNEDGRLNNKNQRTKVLSTKLPVDKYDSFNLLVEHLSKTGAIQTFTPSALLRYSITQLLNTYRNDIESYRIAKNQSTANNNGHQLRNIENNQILGSEHIHSHVNDDGRTYQQGLNMTSVKEGEYPQEKELSMSNKNHEPSSTQSTQEELKEPKEVRFLGNNEQPRTEDPITNLYKLDLAKFMYTLVIVDRRSKDKLVYLEIDK